MTIPTLAGRLAFTGFLFTAVASAAPLSAQGRRAEDRADARRTCPAALRAIENIERRVVGCAEWFVGQQGYPTNPAAGDTSLIVPEGIEWRAGRARWLQARAGSLESRAVGVCLSGELVSVVFRRADTSAGDRARGVTLTRDGHELRMVHSDFRYAYLLEPDSGCRLLDEGQRRRTGPR